MGSAKKYLEILLLIMLGVCHETHSTEYEGTPTPYSDELCLPQPVCNGKRTTIVPLSRCQCDDLCVIYDECCPDAPVLDDGLSFKTSVTPDNWECLPNMGEYDYDLPQNIYMVTSCPKTADSQLALKCSEEEHPSEDYSFLQDIPAKSIDTGIMYRNVFCAQCHNDAKNIENASLKLECFVDGFINVGDLGVLKTMKYVPGSLEWTGTVTENLSIPDYVLGKTIKCDGYYDIEGRSCTDVERKCANSWPLDETRARCSSHGYRVMAHGVFYKNWYCAICNNNPAEIIQCLPHDCLTCDIAGLFPVFKPVEECDEGQVWNYFTEECDPVSCIYSRNLTIILSNGSLYINTTGKIYREGEYKVLGTDEVEVCSQQQHDIISSLQQVSTITICISLVCMMLHLILFLAQPERKSVPSLNHTCMVCSLFIAELVFLLTFYGLDNYHLCIACALVMDFCFTASFLWTSVISFDMCRAFRSGTFRRKGLKTFAIYFGFVCIPCLLKTAAVLFLDRFSADFFLNPKLGRNHCWYNKTWSLSLFFLGPILIIVALNVFTYIFFIFELSRQQKSAEFAAAAGKRNRKPRETNTLGEGESKTREGHCRIPADDSVPPRPHQDKTKHNYRNQLLIYIKVAVAMGVTWVLSLIVVFTHSILLEYLSTTLSGLQGTFIFLAFDCKREKWRNILKYFRSKRSEGKLSSTECYLPR